HLYQQWLQTHYLSRGLHELLDLPCPGLLRLLRAASVEYFSEMLPVRSELREALTATCLDLGLPAPLALLCLGSLARTERPPPELFVARQNDLLAPPSRAFGTPLAHAPLRLLAPSSPLPALEFRGQRVEVLLGSCTRVTVLRLRPDGSCRYSFATLP